MINTMVLIIAMIKEISFQKATPRTGRDERVGSRATIRKRKCHHSSISERKLCRRHSNPKTYPTETE